MLKKITTKFTEFEEDFTKADKNGKIKASEKFIHFMNELNEKKPESPSRSPSGYNQFTKWARLFLKELTKDDKDVKVDFSAIAGLWRKMTDSEKDEWKTAAKEEDNDTFEKLSKKFGEVNSRKDVDAPEKRKKSSKKESKKSDDDEDEKPKKKDEKPKKASKKSDDEDDEDEKPKKKDEKPKKASKKTKKVDSDSDDE
jgi:hypothetical protein